MKTELRYCPLCEENVTTDKDGNCLNGVACGGTYSARSVRTKPDGTWQDSWGTNTYEDDDADK